MHGCSLTLGYVNTYAILQRMAEEQSEADTLMDIYTRKSVKVSGRRGELSPSAQESRGRDWGEWNKLKVRKVWGDRLSASKDVKRPDYDKALVALAAGEIKTLWCYKLDRFSRKGALAVLKVLENLNGGRIIFGEDGLDSSDPNHRRMIMWKAEDAAEESARISQRVTDTKTWQRDHGEWVSGRHPYGLIPTEDRKLIEDKTPARADHPRMGTKATITRRIFREAAAGKSLREIARGLDKDQVPGPMGNRWNPNTIYRMLHNPAYSGWQVVKLGNGPGVIYTDKKGKRVRVGVTLITDDDREAATRAIAGHTKPDHSKAGEARGRARHLLTGTTRCEGCNRLMPRMSRSYACMSAQGGKPCPRPASAYGPAVEEYVFERWVSRLVNADEEDPLLVVVAERYGAMVKPTETAELEATRAALAASEAEMGRLLRDRRAGLYEGAASRFFEPAWEEVTRDVDEARQALRALGGASVDIGFLLEEYRLREHWEAADMPLRRDLLRLAIDRVTIRKVTMRGPFDGPARVDIRWADHESE